MHFLNTYAKAIDTETGEAVMVIVFFDDVNVLGESAKHRQQGWMKNTSSTIPPAFELPVVPTSSVLGGAGIVDSAFKHLVDESTYIGTRRLRSEIPDFAIYKASPQWSLKFSDAIGLDRASLPCIVAFDDETDSPEGDYTVLPIDDPGHTWNVLREALDSYAMDDRVQAFNQAVESMDETQRAESKTHELQISITNMVKDFPTEWKTILDLGTTGPGKRLAQVQHAIRWVAEDGSGEMSELATQFLELLGNPDYCARQRKFVVAYEAMKRLDFSSSDPFAQLRKIKVIGMAASALGEDPDEMIKSAEATNANAVISRLSSSAPMDIGAMHRIISGIYSYLSNRLDELTSLIPQLSQGVHDSRQLAWEMPRVSFRAVLLEAMDNDATTRRNRRKRSAETLPVDFVRASTGVVNLLSAILDLARKIAGWA